MPDLPPPIETKPAAAGRRWSLALWVLLAIVVGSFMHLNIFGRRRVRGASDRVSGQLRMMCRYAVGVRELQKLFPQSTGVDAAEELVVQLEDSTETAADQVAVIPALAELKSEAFALSQIEKLLSNNPTMPRAQRDHLLTLRRLYERGPDTLPGAQREKLRRHFGWSGRLAASHGLPADSEERQEVLAQALFTALAVVGITGAILAGLALGGILLVCGAVLYKQGKLKPAYPQDREQAAAGRVRYFELFVLALTMILVLPLAGGALQIRWLYVVNPLLIFLALWLPLRGVPWEQARIGLGWHPGRHLVKEILMGLVGYVAGLPIIAVGLLLTLLAVRAINWLGLEFLPPNASHPVVEQLQGGNLSRIVTLFILATIVAPMLEETFFRGAFYHYLRRGRGVFLSVMVTGVIFAAVHPQSIAGIPALTTIGAVLALIREWRGSLVAPMVAHACNNFIVLIIATFLLR